MSLKTGRLVIPLLIGMGLCILFAQGMNFSQAAPTLPSSYSIVLQPDQLTLTGDVATITNTVGYCAAPWLANTPSGTIILGVNPTSCEPAAWRGGAATAQVFLQAVYSPTVYTLKLTWPDRDGKGLHSPEKNRAAVISLDNRLLWGKRTTQQSTFNDYYGAQHEPILTTIVVTRSITHTLMISVPAQTAWDLSQIELRASAYPTRTRGTGYSPYRDCQYPGGTFLPTRQDIEEDLVRLFHTSNAIRTYSATGVNNQIPSLANAVGLPVFAGAWLDWPTTASAQDDAEIQSLINLADATRLEGIIVGNEYYLRHRSVTYTTYLQQRVIQVKNSLHDKSLPVTTAEIDNLMFDWESDSSVVPTRINPLFRPILEQVDFVLVHIYPFWNGLPIEGAAAFTVNRYHAIQALINQEFPGQNKRVIIGEAGWPSRGQTNKQAVPSPGNQRRYMREFLILAEQSGVDYMFFDAFDELWKSQAEGPVGRNWGYSYSDRTAKHDFYGLLLPTEQILPLPSSYRVYLPYVSSTSNNNQKPFSLYSEWPMQLENFVPSGWIGDIANIEMYQCERANPHDGEMAIRASFSPTGTLGWGGVYWQYPENNWGDMAAGLDLSWANKLTFWAKGKSGGEKVRFFVGGIGTQYDPYPDSLRPQVSTDFIRLSSTWQKYTVNLYGQDLRHVIGGFGWATDKCANPGGATFYLDEIAFEFDPNLVPPSPHGPVFAIYTDTSAEGNHYFPSNWMGDAGVQNRVSLTECWYDNPHSGQTSIRVAYTQQVIGWAGIYWVHPVQNTGDRPGGYDLTGADRLTFWARSDTQNAQVKFLIGGIGYRADYQGNAICSDPLGSYPDSVCPKIEKWAVLSPTWTKYTIDLHQYPRDLRKVVGGFGWVAEAPVTFYLDDIAYEFN